MSEEDSRTPSFVDGFKLEWSLFWHNFFGEAVDGTEIQDASSTTRKKLATMSSGEVGHLAKSWSQERRKLQLELEEIQDQVDDNIKRLESLRLVGGMTEGTEQRIGQLSDQGQSLSKKIQWLADRLDDVREFQIEQAAATVE